MNGDADWAGLTTGADVDAAGTGLTSGVYGDADGAWLRANWTGLATHWVRMRMRMGIGKEMGTHCEDECRCWWPRDNNRARCECR